MSLFKPQPSPNVSEPELSAEKAENIDATNIERILHLHEQYLENLQSLNTSGVLQLLILQERPALGIIGIDGKEYPIPTYEAVRDAIIANQERLTPKIAQGFAKLQLTPFATPIEILQDRFIKLLRRHHKEGKLFDPRRNPKDSHIPIGLNPENSPYIYNNFIKGEISGDLLYYVKQFDQQNHGGQTKQQLIETAQTTPFPGWNPLFIESDLFLAQEGNGKTIHGRKQLENNHTPIEYLKTLGEPPYRDEEGFTIEDFLTKCIIQLETHNEVSNVWEDNNAMFLLGNYLASRGFLPFGYWFRGSRMAFVGDVYPDSRGVHWGAGPVVRILTS